MKKLFKSFLALIIAVVSLVTPYSVMAANVPESITVTTSPATLGYIGEDVNFGTKTLADGSIAYCLDYTMNTPVVTTVGLIGEADPGMAYLMENGFPNKSITGNNDKDYYITQTAIWWYLDLVSPKASGNYGITEGFKTTDADPQGLRPIIKDLVTKAVEANNRGYKNPTITASIDSDNLTINNEKTYFVSNLITVNGNDIDTYTVSLEGIDEGSYVTDENGNVKNTFNAGEKFMVYVPVNDNRENKTFTVKLTANATYNKVFKYLRHDEGEQDILLSLLYPETINKDTTLTLNVNYPKIDVPDTNASTLIMNLLGSFTIAIGLLFTRKYAKKVK